MDVFFGGIADAFEAGKKEGLFEPYVPKGAEAIPQRFRDPDGYWTGVAVNPICFMTGGEFLRKHGLPAPRSWQDLLAPAYRDGLVMADARTSGTAVSRLFSLVLAMGEDEAFAYQKKLDGNVQQYTKSGAGGALPIARGQAAGGIFFLVDALEMQQTGTTSSSAILPKGSPTAGSHGARPERKEPRPRPPLPRLGGNPRHAAPVRGKQDQPHPHPP